MNTKKICNFRLDQALIKEFDLLPGSRTLKVTNAIQNYLSASHEHLHDESQHDTQLVTVLQDQIRDIKQDKIYLQNQINALMADRLPWYKRFLLKEKN